MALDVLRNTVTIALSIIRPLSPLIILIMLISFLKIFIAAVLMIIIVIYKGQWASFILLLISPFVSARSPFEICGFIVLAEARLVSASSHVTAPGRFWVKIHLF